MHMCIKGGRERGKEDREDRERHTYIERDIYTPTYIQGDRDRVGERDLLTPN